MSEYIYKLDGLGTGKHSKREIIESLKQYAEMHGVDTILTRQYDEWKYSPVSTRHIIRVFGSWGMALQAAGLRSVRTAKLQFREMVEAFKACWKEHDAHRPESNSKYIWRSIGILSGGPAIVWHMVVM